MAEARFFTLRQCPDCMCDLPHRRRPPGAISTGEIERSAVIGTIIRLNFPQEIAPRRCDLTKAWPARQHLLCRPGRRNGPDRRSRRISVAKQRNGRGFNGPDSVQKIPNLKAFPLRFF